MLWQSLLLETQILARLVDSFIAPPPVQVRRSTTAEFLTALAVVLACLATVGLGFGIFMWLRETYTLRETIVYMCSYGLLLAAFSGGVAWTIDNYRSIKARITGKVIKHRVNNLFDALREEFGDVVAEYPKTATALAALAGAAVGEKAFKEDRPHLRDIIPESYVQKAETAIKEFLH